MSTHKSIDFICVAVLLLTLLLTVLFINGERFGIRVVADEDAEGAAASARFTANDLDGNWDSTRATVITLKGDSASISGGGAYFHDGDAVIANAGRYVLRGTLDGGSVVVSADSGAKVWLLLDGVTIRCDDDACLRVEQADKVFLTLPAGSANSMTSGAAYSEQALADKRDGALFSHDDLTINGSGSLTVTAACGHGIAANDDLVITGGRLRVSAPRDAIRANDGLRIRSASITAEAGDDALALKAPEGLLLIESGSFSLSAAQNGIHSGGAVQLAGGELEISAAQDGIHCAGGLLLADGRLEISAGDDGLHSDTGISVTGGTLLIRECYEGVEALTIDISGGDLTIFPRDDGLNANGGAGGFGPPAPGASEENEETWIHISGGTLTVVNQSARDADGLDSNGDILISGGVIRVSLPAGGTNSALDYGSERGGICAVSGGEIVACGSFSMAESFDASSTQCAVLYNFSEGAEAGTTVSVETLDGRTLLRYTPPCSYSSVALSSPKLKLGETYRIVIGGSAEEITLTETAAAYGNAASSMFGGSMNWGGMKPPGGSPGPRPEGAPMGPPPDRPGTEGERPEGAPMGPPPDRPGAEDERPESAPMGPPPDWSGTEGERPEGAPMGPPPDPPGAEGERPETDAVPDTPTQAEQTQTEQPQAGTTPFVPSRETWYLVGLYALILAGALALVIRYKP